MKVWRRTFSPSLKRIPGDVDVFWLAAGQPGDHRPLDFQGDAPDRRGVVRGGDGEAGLDDVDAQLGKLERDLDLLVGGERRAGRLLAVTKRRIKDQESVHGSSLVGQPHDLDGKRSRCSSPAAAGEEG